MRNTCDRKALEPVDQQRSPLHSGQEEAKCIPQFPHLPDVDENTSESGCKGSLLFLGWSLYWDESLRRTILSLCGRREGRELDRGGSGGRRGRCAWLSAEITASPFQLPGDIIRLQRQQEEAQA